MPRTPSVFPFSGRLRRRAINPTPPKRVKAWGDGPRRPEVMYPGVEHTRTDCAARNHSRSRAPHHRTQSFAKKKRAIATKERKLRPRCCFYLCPDLPKFAWERLYVLQIAPYFTCETRSRPFWIPRWVILFVTYGPPTGWGCSSHRSISFR